MQLADCSHKIQTRHFAIARERETMEFDYDETLNIPQDTTIRGHLFGIRFSLLSVVVSGSVAFGDLLYAPSNGAIFFERVLSPNNDDLTSGVVNIIHKRHFDIPRPTAETAKLHWRNFVGDRGRDGCRQPPPAQIRTRSTTSYGSCC